MLYLQSRTRRILLFETDSLSLFGCHAIGQVFRGGDCNGLGSSSNRTSFQFQVVQSHLTWCRSRIEIYFQKRRLIDIVQFHPDPSCIFHQLDETFYCASSSFNVFPGIPIHASKDLTNWRLVGMLHLPSPKVI